MKRPLSGVRIVDFTHFVAGPWATTMLGDFGADVIKIEHPTGGDGSRHLDNTFGAGMSSYFVGLNRSKRSLALDLSSQRGRAVIQRLIGTADVLIANFRPGVMERLGLGYESLAAKFPRLIYVSITAFGERGPLSHKPAMDIIVQAAGGIMGLTGEANRAPVKIGAPIADFVGSYLAFSAVSLGLYVREKHGMGQPIEINLLDGQVSMLANFMPGHAITGVPEGPQGGGHPQIVPYQVFETSDGNIVVGCLTQEFWLGFIKVLGLSELQDDPRFASNAARVANRDALVPMIAAAIRGRSKKHWLKDLMAQGVPCGEVASLGDVASNSQVRQNEMVVEMDHPKLGTVTIVGNPLKLRGTPPQIGRPAPTLGEHSQEILEELGFDADEIDECRSHRSLEETQTQ